MKLIDINLRIVTKASIILMLISSTALVLRTVSSMATLCFCGFRLKPQIIIFFFSNLSFKGDIFDLKFDVSSVVKI